MAPVPRPFAFVALHHVQLAMPRGEEDAARAFWSGVLGMTELAKPPVLAARGGCWFRGGGIEVHLGVEDPFAPAKKAHPGLLVRDLPALAAAIEQAGSAVVWDGEFPGHHRCYADDPFGNRLEFLEPEQDRPGPDGPGAFDAMTIPTARLLLHPIDEAEARRIHDRAPDDEDRWADDYPFDGDLAGIGALLRAIRAHGDQRPFGYYRATRREDGLAIGGIGFKGRPQDGAVEVGYGFVPSARGRGYATEALEAVLRAAAGLGVATVRADTEPDNLASQRVLEKAGFQRIRAEPDAFWFEVRLPPLDADPEAGS